MLCAALACSVPRGSSAPSAAAPDRAVPAYVPPIKHVFVINIENKGYDTTWGPGSKAPYLAKTLRRKGVLLNEYYGTAHNSQPNYVAQISGQGPNPQMQGDCQIYSAFVRAGTRVSRPGGRAAAACSRPRCRACQPAAAHTASPGGATWRACARRCAHPALNTQDPTQQATPHHQYAVRHDPFMYFQAITGAASCARHVVPLHRLQRICDIRVPTPHFAYITPNLCDDGHDSPCADGRPGGLPVVNAWLKIWVPRILHSPAYQRDGMLVITADESDSPQSDASACCGEGPGPNTPLPGILGLGGGRIGALVLSPLDGAGHLEHDAVQPLLVAGLDRGHLRAAPPRLRPRQGPRQVRPGRLQQRLAALTGRRVIPAPMRVGLHACAHPRSRPRSRIDDLPPRHAAAGCG